MRTKRTSESQFISGKSTVRFRYDQLMLEFWSVVFFKKEESSMNSVGTLKGLFRGANSLGIVVDV
jgi:hypothetical protein